MEYDRIELCLFLAKSEYIQRAGVFLNINLSTSDVFNYAACRQVQSCTAFSDDHLIFLRDIIHF